MQHPDLQGALEAHAPLGAVEEAVEKHVPEHRHGGEHQRQRTHVRQGLVHHQRQHRRGEEDGQALEGQGVEDPLLESLVEGGVGVGHGERSRFVVEVGLYCHRSLG